MLSLLAPLCNIILNNVTSCTPIPTIMVSCIYLCGLELFPCQVKHFINSPNFRQPEVSLPRSQEPGLFLYPEQDQSIPPPPSRFLKSHFKIILASTPRLYTSRLVPSGFSTKTQYAALPCPIHATCCAHLILHIITRIIFREEHRS
jgi:hypothetical protein